MNDDERRVEFRFKKGDIYTLAQTFRLPEMVRCYNGIVIDSVEALCICLKRYAYPCRYADLIPRFGRPVPQLCMAANVITDMIFDRFHRLLTDLDQPWLSPHNLQTYADAIHNRGAALENCWGLWMVQFDPFANQGGTKEWSIMVTKGFMPLNFNLWLPQMD